MTNTNPLAEWLTPAQMTEATGVNIDTLRYYERENLLQSVKRNSSGHRRYSSNDVLWVQVLRCLRQTGMTIEQLRTYCNLGEQGDHTEPERLQLLLQHREKVEQELQEIISALKMIDHKIEFYDSSIKQGSKP